MATPISKDMLKFISTSNCLDKLLSSNPNAPPISPPIMTTQLRTKNGSPAIRIPVKRNLSSSPSTYTTAANTSTSTSTSTSYYTSTPTGTSIHEWYRDTNPSFIDDIKEITLEDIYRAIQTGLIDIQIGGHCDVTPGAQLNLPDGSKINVKSDGNFTINDSNAKVTYKGNRTREFNQYMNASDLLEEFIKDLGKVGVKQNQFLNIPIEAFINWLIHKAAEQDGDPPPQDVKLLEDEVHERKHPKCLHCGKFISPDLPAQFCNGDHYQQYLEKK